jgi:hypothetical protein
MPHEPGLEHDEEQLEPMEPPNEEGGEPSTAGAAFGGALSWDAIRPPAAPAWEGLQAQEPDDEEEEMPALGPQPPSWRVPERGGFADHASPNRGTPLWGDYADRAGGGAYLKMRVYRARLDGVRESLGSCPANLTEEALAHQHGPGDYNLMPISAAGKPLLQEDIYVTIPHDHPILIARAASGRHTGGEGGVLGQTQQQATSIELMLKHLAEERKAEAERREIEDQRLADRANQLRAAEIEAAKAMANVGAKAASQTESVMLRFAENDQKRQQEALLSVRAAYETAAQAREREQREIAERTRALEEKAAKLSEASHKSASELLLAHVQMQQTEALKREERLEREAKEREAKMERDRKESEQRAQDWLKMQLAVMNDQAKQREQAAREEIERQRVHNAMMMEAFKAQMTNSNPLGALGTIVAQAAPVLAVLGLEPSDIGEKLRDLFSGGSEKEEPRSLVSELSALAIEGMKTWRTMAVPGAPQQGIVQQIPQALPVQPAQIEQREPQGIPGMMQLPPSMGQPTGAPVSAVPGVPAAPGIPAVPVDPVDAIPKESRQRARRALSALVKQLQAEPESEWETAITICLLQTHADTLPYLQARTLRGVGEDSGASPEFIERFIAVIDKVPQAKDIPRG